MSALDSLVYKYLLENGNTEAAAALKKKNPSVSFYIKYLIPKLSN
jgi:hypothetical protein